MNSFLKNRRVFFLLCLLVFFLAGFVFYKQLFAFNKIAYIDSTRIYNGYKGIKIAKVEFEKKVEFFKSRMDTLSAKVKMDIMKIDQSRNNNVMRQQFADSARFHKQQLIDYQKAMSESLREEEGRLTQRAMVKLNDFIKEYGNNHNYDMILIASPSGTIAYSKERFDITEIILAEANEKL